MVYIAFIIFTLLVLLFVFYKWQYFMIFSPLIYREKPLCEKCNILTMQSDDGIELEGALYEPENSHATLLVFVGRSHDAVALINKLALLYSHVRIITFNYRSYGKSAGVVNEKNMLKDGVKIAELVQKNYGSFYILGFSIGSSVAAFVASKVDVNGLFLIGAFDSIASLVKKKYGVDLSWLLRYKFTTKNFVKSVDADTYLFVSRDDEITYIENARKLKESVKNLTYYTELDGLTHKELLWDKKVVDKIKGILEWN